MLSTTVENQDVRIDVRLNNASAKDALYTDPIIEVDLPEQVENINIKRLVINGICFAQKEKICFVDKLKRIKTKFKGLKNNIAQNQDNSRTI